MTLPIYTFIALDKETQGGCEIGTRECGLNCLEYDKQCDGKCYGGMVTCGESDCTGAIGSYGSTDYTHKNCTVNGVETCIKKDAPCDGKCPDGMKLCGSDKCINPSQENYYYTCKADGKCKSIRKEFTLDQNEK